jgi:tetratricopeptide (TPR) repeat protein
VASRFIDATLSRPATFDDQLVALVDALAFEQRNRQALDLLDSTSAELAQGQVDWTPRSLKRAEILSRLGRAEEAREEYATAERQATAALLDAPEDPRIHAALGLASAGLGKAEAAVNAARRAVALVPYEKDAMDAWVYSWNLALVYARLGRHDEAMRQVGIYLSHPGIYSEAWVRAHPDFAG